MTKKQMMEMMGIEYTPKRAKAQSKNWFESALIYHYHSKDKDQARKFIQQFLPR